jgi:hypothetical protein
MVGALRVIARQAEWIERYMTPSHLSRPTQKDKTPIDTRIAGDDELRRGYQNP